MGRRGPKPKPTASKRLAGNPGKRRLDPNEIAPEPVSKIPPAPEWLSKIAVAKWHEVGPTLIEKGLLTTVDMVQFAMCCQAVADVIECQEIIDAEGRTETTKNGNTVQHPAVGMKNRAMELVAKFAAKFGMSPAERVGLVVDQQDKKPKVRARVRK